MKNVKSGHSKPIVCLDAGHYGKYNRSPVVKAYYESDMNWKLHNLLKAELEKYGIEVQVTRATQAKDLDLTARGLASKGCDLFISIHSNAASDEAVKYVVALYQVDDNCGEMDEQSKEFAAVLSKTVGTVMGLPYQSRTTLSSQDRDGNGYKDDYYGVLRGAHTAHTPGVIIEHGFHTNTATANWLLLVSNLQKLAEAEAKAVADWFGVEKPKATKTIDLELPVLKKGAKGDEVKALQALLIGYGYKMENNGKTYGVDGSFGTATENAVKKYQAANGLEVDASVGRKTWTKLLGV